MEKLICAGCAAPLVPDTSLPALTCEYCGTVVTNPYYIEAHAQAAKEPTLQEMCVQTLVEMGQSEQLHEIDENCFGNPISGARDAREAMEVPQEENLYFLIDHLSIFGNIKECIALGDRGLYYRCDGEEGCRDWETFITGAISGVENGTWTEAGTLNIGTSLSFSIANDADLRLARFLIDFHNRMYARHTGETAPSSWTISKPIEQTDVQPQVTEPATGGLGMGSLLGGIGAALAAAGTVFGGNDEPQQNQHRPVNVRPPVHRPGGNRPLVVRPNGSCPVGNRPVGSRPVGNRPLVARPTSNRPFPANRPLQPKPAATQPSDNKRPARPSAIGKPGIQQVAGPQRPGGRPGNRPGGRPGSIGGPGRGKR